MNSFALYRLPHQDTCTLVEQTSGDLHECHSCTDLNGATGYMVAPFEMTASQPGVLIRPDRVVEVSLRQTLSFITANPGFHYGKPRRPCRQLKMSVPTMLPISAVSIVS